MLVVENEKYPHICRHSESNQRLAIYPDHASKKKYAKARYTPRFYVDDYAHAQRSFGSFPSMGEAFQWADEFCYNLTPKTAHKEKALKNVYHTVGKNTLQVNWPGEAVA